LLAGLCINHSADLHRIRWKLAHGLRKIPLDFDDNPNPVTSRLGYGQDYVDVRCHTLQDCGTVRSGPSYAPKYWVRFTQRLLVTVHLSEGLFVRKVGVRVMARARVRVGV